MRRGFWAILFSVFLYGCAALGPRTGAPPALGHREHGVASWYGRDFHGRKTSSGVTYDMFGLSAAHRTLPLGTLLLVRSEATGKVVRVKVNDRGPFVSGRILDLSFGAAKEIGLVRAGTGVVRLEVIGFEPFGSRKARLAAPLTLQVGAFKVKENADRLRERLRARYPIPGVVLSYETNRRVLYRVQIGSFSSEEDARKMAEALLKSEGLSSMIIRSD